MTAVQTQSMVTKDSSHTDADVHSTSSAEEYRSAAPSSPRVPLTPGRTNSSVRFSTIDQFDSVLPSTPVSGSGSPSDSASATGSTSPYLDSSSKGPSRASQQFFSAPSPSSYLPRLGSGSGVGGGTYKRSTTTSAILTLNPRRPRPSTKLRGEIEKPWTKYPDPAHRWSKIIFWVLAALGLASGALSESLGLSAP